MFRKLLLAALCAFPTAAHAEWQEASSPHFVVYADEDPAKIREFAERLERFDAALRKLFATPQRRANAAGRVSVYVLDSLSDIRKLYGAGGRNVGGFYNSRASGSVAFVPSINETGGIAQLIFLHEYAHHFMYANWTGAVFPKWFSEGFAEFAGMATFRSDGTILFGAVPGHRSGTVATAGTMPAERLVQLDPGKLDSLATERIYSRGWLLTHYLLFDKERAGQLAAYIGAINAGKPVDEANALLGDISTLDGKLNTYVRRPTMQTAAVAPGDLPPVTVTLRKLTAGEAATMPARIRSTRGVDEKLAQEVVVLARQLAAPYPNDAGAQNMLAEAEFDAKNYAAAEAAADRAIAADPKSVHALLYKGMAQMEVAKKDGVTDPARWQAIRRSFLAANKVDSEDPEPLRLFYQSYIDAKQAPTANADAALIYAYALAPFDMSLRVTAATVLLRQGKAETARIALEPVAYGAHSGAFGEKVKEALAALDSKGTDAALELLTKALEPEAAKKEA